MNTLISSHLHLDHVSSFSSFRIFDQNFATVLISHVCYIHHPSPFASFYHPNNISRRVQVKKSLTTELWDTIATNSVLAKHFHTRFVTDQTCGQISDTVCGKLVYAVTR